jgi:hypothetical protein
MAQTVECIAHLYKGVYVARTVERSLMATSGDSLLDAQRGLADSLHAYEATSKRPLRQQLELRAWATFASIASAVLPSRLGIEHAHWNQPIPTPTST